MKPRNNLQRRGPLPYFTDNDGPSIRRAIEGWRRKRVCGACREYQRGERTDQNWREFPIHACERIPHDWIAGDCPCGCFNDD